MPTIQHRRMSTAQWAAQNPVLAAGEIGLEVGVGSGMDRFKIGNGLSPWAQLTYFLNETEIKLEVSEITKEYLDLENVDNTSDLNKPVSSAQAEINDKVSLGQYVSLVEPPIYPGVSMTIGTTSPPWISSYIAPTQQGVRFEVVGPPLVGDGQANQSYWASWNGSDPGANVVSHEDAMFVQGPYITAMVFTYGPVDVQAMVDGKLVKPSWSVFPEAAGFYFVTLEFTDDLSPTKVRNIRWFYGQCGLYQYVLGPNQDMWPDRTKRYTFGIVAFDSYMHGAGGTTEGSISGGTLAMQLSIFSGGKTRTINAGSQGGTGVLNPGTGTTATVGPNGQTPYGSAIRLAQAALWIDDADCLITGGMANDGDDFTYPVSSVVAAAIKCWTDYAALAPDKPLIVLGIEPGVFPNIAAKLDTLNAALKAAAINHPDVTAYVDWRENNIVYGTGKINAKTGDGNADIMICSDGVHLSRFGNEFVIRVLIALLSRILVPRV